MLTALATLEMRWFLTGCIPPDVITWFQASYPDNAVEQSERVDRYLYLPDCEVVGIKLRAEKFEVKWRTQVLGQPTYGDNWVSDGGKGMRSQLSPHQGQLEHWQKLSYGDLLDASAIFQAAQSPAKVWLSVHKQRWLHCVQGVQIELVQLSINQQAWWSFSLEEETPVPSDNHHLEQVLWQLISQYLGPPLTLESSYAFPSWLSRLSVP